MANLRCLIVDDSPHFLAAARAVLERGGLAVAGVATTIDEALRRADELQPDFVLIDMHIGDESGFDLAVRLEEEIGLPPSRMILTSTHAESDFTEMIKAAGTAGFIPKAALSAQAIRRFLGGGSDAVEAERPSGSRGT